MSVLIKGIDLPEAYTSAWLTVFECVGEHTFIKTHKVSAEQMQAIPPHGRLIDADDAFIDADERGCDFWSSDADIDSAQEFLRAQPTFIEAEEGEEE